LHTRHTDTYPVTCRDCGHAGSVAFWTGDTGQWGVTWVGFAGREALLTMPRRARGRCDSCKSRNVEIGEASRLSENISSIESSR
jgi:hypothetical protein